MITLADAIADARRGVKRMVKCPAHDDGTASLSVSPGDDQPVLLKCFAECPTEKIIADSGLDWAEVCKPLDPSVLEDQISTFKGPASHCYRYVDEEGEELYQVLRVPQPNGSKVFLQRHWDAAQDGWSWNIQGVRRVLYRLHEVKRAIDKGRTIFIPEGEKDVETLRAHGFAATCSPMGAGKWDDSYSESLAGADVVVIADADEPGRRHARQVFDSLDEAGCSVRVMETTLANCNDVTDHYAKGGTVESLVQVHTNQREPVPSFGLGIQDFLAQELPVEVEVIPGMLAYANVAILTGWEGQGKSELCRQIAVQCAAGITPFTGAPMPERKVLYIDPENPEHQTIYSWSNLAGLAARHRGSMVPNENLTILSEWRNEPDLLTLAGQAWLYERINAYKPDICIMGPVQNLVGRDVKDDEVVRKLKHAVNTARAMFGTAFILEHHSPHRSGMDPERPVRPYGSSLFLKWPDYGYGLRPVKDREGVFDLVPNRKPRVRSRAWPEQLQMGKPGTMEFPWMEAEPELPGQVYHGQFGSGA